jgi:hypothetical protein
LVTATSTWNTHGVESSATLSTPKLGLVQPMFGNSYLYMKHIGKYEIASMMATPNLGIMQQLFGNSYFYMEYTWS